MSYRVLLLAVLLGTVTFLAGCSYTPARIDPEPLIVIGDDHGGGHAHHGRGFCPPGQAMKGRC